MGRRDQDRECDGGMSGVSDCWTRRRAPGVTPSHRDRKTPPRCARGSSPCRRREIASPVDDLDVLLRIDRHRAVVGAEHHAVGAEHLDRLAHMRRPEAHGVDVKQLEILARPPLAADHRRAPACRRSRAASRNRAGPSPAAARRPCGRPRSSGADNGRTGPTGSCGRAPWRCRTDGRPARRACTGPSAARGRSARAADG